MNGVKLDEAIGENDAIRCYRPSCWLLWGGLLFIAMGLMFVVVAVLSAYDVLQPGLRYRDRTQLSFGYICFALIGTFVIAWYLKYRLIVKQDELVQIGLFGTKRMPLSEMTKVQWRLFARDVVLWAGNRRLRVDIDCLLMIDQAAVTLWLHERFPAHMHHGWAQARRPLHIGKVEPIHWGRIVCGTVVASALAIPMMFLAAWISPTRHVQAVFMILFFPSLAAMLYAGQKLGLIHLKPRQSCE